MNNYNIDINIDIQNKIKNLNNLFKKNKNCDNQKLVNKINDLFGGGKYY